MQTARSQDQRQQMLGQTFHRGVWWGQDDGLASQSGNSGRFRVFWSLLHMGYFLPVCNSVLWRPPPSQLIGWVWSWTFFFRGPSPVRPQMAPLAIWLTPASLLSKQEDYRTIEIKQRAKYDGEPGNGHGLSLMGPLHPFWWIMYELAGSCQPSWSASSYGSSDPNKEGTAVASWLLPQQGSCLTSVFEKPYWSWAGIPWNCLLPL